MILTAKLKVKQRLRLEKITVRKSLNLQFDILGAVEKLKQIIVLALHDIVIYQGCHCHLVLRKLLQARLLSQFVMLSQNVVDVNFL